MKKFTPYTDNIIFVDTEFSSLDPYQGEILSVGMVKLDGRELYVEVQHDGPVSNWVKENILSTLNQPKLTRADAQEKIRKFVGKKNPYLISYVVQYDALYLRKLFGVGDVAHNNDRYPFHWLSIDFASILFTLGIRPEDFARNRKEFCGQLDIDLSQFREHNALDDAKLLREMYLRMVKVAE